MRVVLKRIKSLLDRIPRLAWQVGLDWGHGYVDWGYIILQWDQDIIDGEVEYSDGDFTVVTRRVWISPAKLEAAGEFTGW